MTTNQLGSRVALSTAPATVIKWRTNKEAPRVITVTLLPVKDPTSQLEPSLFNSIFPLRANVTWGAGDVGTSTTIDYPTVGGTFTVTASALQVDVWADGVLTPPTGTSFDTAVQVGAFMGEGAGRPELTPPTFTRQQDNVTFTASGGILFIPPHARAYYVQDDIDNTAFAADTVTWQIDCQNRGLPYPQPGALNTTLRRDAQKAIAATEQRVGPTVSTPFPIPPRCTHLNVTRAMANVPVTASVVFLLDLGA